MGPNKAVVVGEASFANKHQRSLCFSWHNVQEQQVALCTAAADGWEPKQLTEPNTLSCILLFLFPSYKEAAKVTDSIFLAVILCQDIANLPFNSHPCASHVLN